MGEPARAAEAVAALGLRHAVLTSVNRDDLPDGGAYIFEQTIKEIRARVPDCDVEVLIPDFKGDEDALKIVMDAQPEILNHNVETVPRLYKRVRKGSSYARSLDLLEKAGRLGRFETKSAIMLGLGEKQEEVVTVLQDLRKAGVSRVALGQYLRPTRYHLAVEEYVSPEQFADYEAIASDLGFNWVKAGPLVRSSYHAED